VHKASILIKVTVLERNKV